MEASQQEKSYTVIVGTGEGIGNAVMHEVLREIDITGENRDVIGVSRRDGEDVDRLDELNANQSERYHHISADLLDEEATARAIDEIRQQTNGRIKSLIFITFTGATKFQIEQGLEEGRDRKAEMQRTGVDASKQIQDGLEDQMMPDAPTIAATGAFSSKTLKYFLEGGPITEYAEANGRRVEALSQKPGFVEVQMGQYKTKMFMAPFGKPNETGKIPLEDADPSALLLWLSGRATDPYTRDGVATLIAEMSGMQYHQIAAVKEKEAEKMHEGGRNWLKLIRPKEFKKILAAPPQISKWIMSVFTALQAKALVHELIDDSQDSKAPMTYYQRMLDFSQKENTPPKDRLHTPGFFRILKLAKFVPLRMSRAITNFMAKRSAI